MEKRKICYEIGALLYCPALNKGLADSVISEKFGNMYSLAICLEDSISDDIEEISRAEAELIETMSKINSACQSEQFYLPKIFVRVRSVEQLKRLDQKLVPFRRILCGYIFPKYSLDNALAYNEQIININKNSSKIIYMMPILESGDIIDYFKRYDTLKNLKEIVNSVKEYVLGLRVGGNDFCNEFSARRHYDENIYQILPIANVLSDIITVFGRDYVVSGPVWEFFGSDNNEWKEGLKREVTLDRLNGFVGKTVIHPKQIAVVNEGFKVSKKDYEDARSIIEYDKKQGFQVAKSVAGERMNEMKTHGNWAYKIMMLADIYGIS